MPVFSPFTTWADAMQKLAIGITIIVSLAVLAAYSWADAADGEQLVRSRCTVCHNSDRIDRELASKSPAQWEQTVERMRNRGAKLNAQEKKAVLEFLTAADSL